MSKINLVVCVCMVCACVPAGVAAKPFYVGGSYGWSDIDTGISSLTGSANLDETDDGFKFFVGTDINKMFSVEGHYADLGEATMKGGGSGGNYVQSGNSGTIPANNRFSLKQTSFGLSAIVRAPIEGKIKPYGKVGLHAWDIDTSASYAAGLREDDGTQIVYGVGVEVELDKRVSARTEYERYKFENNYVDFFSIGLTIKLNSIRELVMPTW